MKIPLILLLLALTIPLFCGVKEEISTLQQKIAKHPTGDDYLALSLVYLEDQEQEKAFENFLHALDHAPAKKTIEEEKELCQEALKLYFEGPQESENIIKKYEKIFDEHPKYTQLGAILAACWANLGNFNKFFKMFYSNYEPMSFLTDKTKAILLLRLAISEKNEGEREKKRESALKLLEGALEKNNKDPAIFRQIIVLALEKGDNSLIAKCLEKFVESGINVARGEILFYVTMSCSVDRKDLAESVLKRAKEQYAYSRAIEQAEEVLKNVR